MDWGDFWGIDKSVFSLYNVTVRIRHQSTGGIFMNQSISATFNAFNVSLLVLVLSDGSRLGSVGA